MLTVTDAFAGAGGRTTGLGGAGLTPERITALGFAADDAAAVLAWMERINEEAG